MFLLDRAEKLISEGEMDGGDDPYSLFEGIEGMAYLILDMTDPSNARFPGHELRKSKGRKIGNKNEFLM